VLETLPDHIEARLEKAWKDINAIYGLADMLYEQRDDAKGFAVSTLSHSILTMSNQIGSSLEKMLGKPSPLPYAKGPLSSAGSTGRRNILFL